MGNGGGGITLTARAYKVKGWQMVDLTWNGVTTSDVDIFRDGEWLATAPSAGGSYTDDIGQRGLGTYTYRVCEIGTGVCSNVVTVTF